jgi:hypothetical protein
MTRIAAVLWALIVIAWLSVSIYIWVVPTGWWFLIEMGVTLYALGALFLVRLLLGLPPRLRNLRRFARSS